MHIILFGIPPLGLLSSQGQAPTRHALARLIRSHKVQATVTVSRLEAMRRTFVHKDRHFTSHRHEYSIEDFNAVCADPCLEDCQNFCFSVCLSPTLDRLHCCPQQLQERLLGSLEGYMRHPNASRWCAEELLRMLLANETRPFPDVWIQSEMVGTLGPALLTHFPQVAEWVRTFNADSKPMRLFIIRSLQNLTIRFEQWILHSPTERLERVLAYRTTGDADCSCCRGPACWKLPGGNRGCGTHVMSLVARHVSHEHWRQLTATLSRSEQGLLAHCLMHDVIGTRIFEWCSLEPDCLTCTCDECPLGPSRAGVMCPGEISHVSTGLLRVSSPRQPCETLWDPKTFRLPWDAYFDDEIRRARELQQRVSARALAQAQQRR